MRRPENERSLERKVRNSYAISTVSIALVLFLLGGVGYMIMGAMKVSDSVRENITLYVALSAGASDEQTAGVGVRLRDMPQVREVKYVSKEEAAASFKEEIGSDFENFLSFNPLPDTYEIKLHAQFSDKESLGELEVTIAGWDEVGEVFYQRSVAEQIGSNLSRFNLILLFFGGALLVIALILLNNTIRLTIYSKRYLINTMKLVGATKWFIKKPFLGRSIVQGLLAWFIAAVMLVILVAGIGRGLPEITWLSEHNPVLIILTAMLLLSLLISVLFTNFAVNKFVKMSSSEVHLY